METSTEFEKIDKTPIIITGIFVGLLLIFGILAVILINVIVEPQPNNFVTRMLIVILTGVLAFIVGVIGILYK